MARATHHKHARNLQVWPGFAVAQARENRIVSPFDFYQRGAMANTAEITIEGKKYEFPLIEGSEKEKAIDVSQLRAQTNCITLDDGYGNTGSCKSAVTFIDGEQGILRYRGIPIEELCQHASFTDVAFLLIFGHLPNKAELERWRHKLTIHAHLNEAMKHHFEGFPSASPPMASTKRLEAWPSKFDVRSIAYWMQASRAASSR